MDISSYRPGESQEANTLAHGKGTKGARLSAILPKAKPFRRSPDRGALVVSQYPECIFVLLPAFIWEWRRAGEGLLLCTAHPRWVLEGPPNEGA